MAQLCSAASSRSLLVSCRASLKLVAEHARCCLVPLHSRQSSRARASVSFSTSRRNPILCMAAGDTDGATSTATAPAPETAGPSAAELTKLLPNLDLRVGRIVKAWKHPEADSLYVEEVECGDAEGPRTICSGLVKYIPEEELQGRLVVVLANLKPRNMRGVKSNGMLLAASDASHENVELLEPPEGASPGERIWFGAEEDAAKQEPAATPNQLQKKKVWEAIQPLLKTSEDRIAGFEEKAMRVAAGYIKCKSLTGANVG